MRAFLMTMTCGIALMLGSVFSVEVFAHGGDGHFGGGGHFGGSHFGGGHFDGGHFHGNHWGGYGGWGPSYNIYDFSGGVGPDCWVDAYGNQHCDND